jgi:uncharacterized membrane protein YphA (DoxX/SURF4 family)
LLSSLAAPRLPALLVVTSELAVATHLLVAVVTTLARTVDVVVLLAAAAVLKPTMLNCPNQDQIEATNTLTFLAKTLRLIWS